MMEWSSLWEAETALEEGWQETNAGLAAGGKCMSVGARLGHWGC